MPRTVLIVEDVETCAAALEIALSGMDVNLITVASGEQALRVVEDSVEDVDAIITDLDMRGMDGFELIERVRAHRRHRAVPIVVITGSADPDVHCTIRRISIGNARV